MKKDKSAKKAPGDFKTNPFKPLKGFTPKAASAAGKPAVKKRSATPAPLPAAEDESALFLRAVAGARKLHRAEGPRVVSTGQRPAERSDVGEAQEDRQLFLDALKNMRAPTREVPQDRSDEEVPEYHASTSRLRQLKRGTIRIQGELDLHGYYRETALAALEHFIADAYRGGQKAVLVITGKGINSPEGPILQGAVAEWLRGKGRGMVAEFAPAPRDRGGRGAFVVFLRSR